MSPPIVARAACASDYGCIIDSWWRSYYAGCSQWQGYRGPIAFRESYGPTIERVLRDATVDVLCFARDPSTLIAWCATGPGRVVHYVWVAEPWRRHGFARAMLAAMPERALYTHETLIWRRHVGPELGPRWRLTPERLYPR